MKTIKNTALRAVALCAAGWLAIAPAKAQFVKQGYLNVDWQVNVPLSNGFADKTSGWGMNFEGGMWLPECDFGIGAFINYQTNNEYVGQRVLDMPAGQLFTDQQHTIFQLPFGFSGRYRLTGSQGVLDPYISMKLGANYARFTSFYSAFDTAHATWGFYLSPEIGTTIYPTQNHNFGFHLAAYFSYATNKTQILSYNPKGLSNFGLRVGVAF